MDTDAIIGRVITRSHAIEKLLRKHYPNAKGGLHATISSLADSLPAILARALRVIATVRNAAAHPDGFTHDSSPPDFERLCNEVELLIPYFANQQAANPVQLPKAPKPPAPNLPAPKLPAPKPKAPASDLDSIHKRLTKLKPTKRAGAINSIKAMFQLTAPISDDAANQILEDLCKRGSITIDAKDKLQIRNA